MGIPSTEKNDDEDKYKGHRQTGCHDPPSNGSIIGRVRHCTLGDHRHAYIK